MKVAFVPTWRGNPYHDQLERALTSLGIEVLCPESLKVLYADWKAGTIALDVVHVHALPYLSLSPRNLCRYALFYWRLSRLRRKGVGLVLTVHDLDNHDTSYAAIEDVIGRRASRCFDAFIAHGPAAKRAIGKRWGSEIEARTEVIPHGNYIEAYENGVTRDAARTSLGLVNTDLVFLFFGMIRPYKGVQRMVKSFRRCKNSAARLIIVGKPVGHATAREIVTLIAGDPRIRFVQDFVPEGDIQVYMNAADVVVLPYRRIFTSGATVLAMSFGKACIAPRLGSMVDVLDDRGAIFFDADKDEDLERAFRSAISSPEGLAAMGRHNYLKALEWSWPKIACSTVALYSRIARHGSAGPADPELRSVSMTPVAGAERSTSVCE